MLSDTGKEEVTDTSVSDLL